MSNYNGYLVAHVGRIRELHERGASTRGIAEALFEVGARAQTSGSGPVEMSRTAHITNLQVMVIYVQQRLGLRVRRVRVLNLTAAGTEIEGRHRGRGMRRSTQGETRPHGDSAAGFLDSSAVTSRRADENGEVNRRPGGTGRRRDPICVVDPCPLRRLPMRGAHNGHDQRVPLKFINQSSSRYRAAADHPAAARGAGRAGHAPA
jgi:hypothetical protein